MGREKSIGAKAMQKEIKVKKGLWSWGGKEIPLISGEFHYWRNNKSHWRAILAAIREMGLEIISTYIPWNYHQIGPGDYDFTGRTEAERDLEGFLRLVEEEGFYLIVRPGPYIYSEWPYGGPPEEATRYHRLHPKFLRLAKDYITHVCAVLAPHQITRGGKIIMIQADNEPTPLLESTGTQYGAFGGGGLFADWLQERYGGEIAALNAAWRTDYRDFTEAGVYYHEVPINVGLPMAERLLPGAPYRRRYEDTLRFIQWYGTEIVRRVAVWYQECGIEVPVYANGWSAYTQDFAALSEVVAVAGVDIYPLPFIKGDKITADEWLDCLDERVKEVKSQTGYLWSAEFQSGLYPISQTGYLPPAHFAYVPLTLMGYGLVGWNWYMLVERDNWYNCPINEWGRKNEYFATHQEVVAVAKRVRPWELEEWTAVSLLNYKPHRVVEPGNWRATFAACLAADLDVAFYDPQRQEAPSTPFLLYAGADWLDRESQARLRAWVEAGGTLICLNRFPQEDEAGAPLNLLDLAAPVSARPVNLPVTFRGGEVTALLEHAGHLGTKVNFFFYRDLPAGATPLEVVLSGAKELLVDVGGKGEESFAFGYLQPLGQGRLVHVGSNPDPRVLRWLGAVLGIPWGARSGTEGVLTTLHRRGAGEALVFVNNRLEQDTVATVELELAALGWATAARPEVQELTNYGGAPTLTPAGPGRLRLQARLGGNQVQIYLLRGQ